MVDQNGSALGSRRAARDRRSLFWVSFGGVSAALAIVAVAGIVAALAGPVVPTGTRSMGFVAGLLATPLIVYLVLLPFVWGMQRRMALAAGEFPLAFRVPIVVGDATARSTATLARLLGASNVRLRANSYATLAIDSVGVHVFKRSGRSPGLIPGAGVTLGGFVSTPVGSTSLTSIVLHVVANGNQVDVPIVPMRLRGNPLRRLQQAELDSARARISDALLRGSVDIPNWPF